MSGYNQNNAGYLPMANHGEFANAAPSAAQYMYYNAGSGYEANTNHSSYSSPFAPPQDSTMLQQHNQLYNNVQQQEQYTVQAHFQQPAPQASYPLTYQPVSAHQSLPHNSLTPPVQNSQASSSAHLQNSWMPPTLGHPNISPTGQRYSSILPYSATNTVPSYTQEVATNPDQTSMAPSAVIGRYQGVTDMQNSATDARRPLQSPQRMLQSPQSQGFVPTSHVPVSSMHMSQHLHSMQQSVNPSQRLTSVPNPSLLNAQKNQSERMTKQNIQTKDLIHNSIGGQVRYENVSSALENRGQANYNRSYQSTSSKSNKPNPAQSVKKQQVQSHNQHNKAAKVGQKTPNLPSQSNLRNPAANVEMHNTMLSQPFHTSFYNQHEDVRQMSLTERRLSAPVGMAMVHDNFIENFNESFNQRSLRSRAPGAERTLPDRGRNKSVISGTAPNRSVVPSGHTAHQRGSVRGAAPQTRGQNVRARATGRGVSGRGVGRGTVGKALVKGGLPVRCQEIPQGDGSTSNDRRPASASNPGTCHPIQWYKHPEAHGSAFQSDMEAMLASTDTDQNAHNRVVQVSSSPKVHERSDALKASAPKSSTPQSPLVSTMLQVPTTPHQSNQKSVSSFLTPSRNSQSSDSSYSTNKPVNHGTSQTYAGSEPVDDEHLREKVTEIIRSIKAEPQGTRGGALGRTVVESKKQNTLSVSTASGGLPHINTLSSNSQRTESNYASLTSVSINTTCTPVSVSSGDNTTSKTAQRNVTIDIPTPSHKSSHMQEATAPSLSPFSHSSSLSVRPPQVSTAVSNISSCNNDSSAKIKSEPSSEMSARDKVYSMWRAGQVVGRVPTRERKRGKEQQCAANTTDKDNSPVVPNSVEKSSQSNQEAPMLKAARPNPGVDRAPFNALFHGHKIMCIDSRQGSQVMVCQFLQECFPDKDKGSVSNCINRALRIKKRALEHPSKEKIITYLTNNRYLLGKVESEPVYTISLDDARRVYHFIYKITNCSSASCVVQHEHQFYELDNVMPPKRKTLTQEIMKRVKSETKSAEDKNYGRISETGVKGGNEKNSDKVSNKNKVIAVEPESNRNQDAEGSDDDGDDLIIVEGNSDPFFICSDAMQQKVGRVCNTIIGQIRSYRHNEENYLVVQDLCDVLGDTEFMSVVDKDNVDFYSCCNEILSFLNSMQSSFVRLTSGQSSLVKEKDIGSYSCDDSTDGSLICPVKRVICKQEVMEEESECSSSKQPRLESTTNNSSKTIQSSPTPSLSASMNSNNSSKPPSSGVESQSRDRLSPGVNASLASSKAQGLENSHEERQRKNPETTDNVSNISNGLDASDVDDSGSIMVFDVSCLTKHNESSNLPSCETVPEQDRIHSQITEALLRDTFYTIAEVAGDKPQSPQNRARSNAKSPVLHIVPGVRASLKPEERETNSNAQNDPVNNENRKSRPEDDSQKIALTSQENETMASWQTQPRVSQSKNDAETNKINNVLTVIDNPYKSCLAEKESSGTTVLISSSLWEDQSSRNDTNDSAIDDKTTSSSSSLCLSTPLGTISSGTVPVTSILHTVSAQFPMVATVSTDNLINVGGDQSLLNAESVKSEMLAEQILVLKSDKETSFPSEKNPRDNVLIVDDIRNPKPLFPNALLAPTTPPQTFSTSSMNTTSIPALYQRSASCDSSASCSTSLQAASSMSFETQPKMTNYSADDLELLSLCNSETHGDKTNRTKQSLLKEMTVLISKNKALQDTVKYYRRELLKSKEKNDNSAKWIKYYENVLKEITATFKDGEPDMTESQENQQTGQEQRHSLSDNASAPIVIDDD